MLKALQMVSLSFFLLNKKNKHNFIIQGQNLESLMHNKQLNVVIKNTGCWRDNLGLNPGSATYWQYKIG